MILNIHQDRVTRMATVFDRMDIEVDRVHSVQCGDDEPMIARKPPTAKMWDAFQVCVLSTTRRRHIRIEKRHAQGAYIPYWLYDRMAGIFGCFMNEPIPKHVDTIRLHLKEGPLREALTMPFVIAGRRERLIVHDDDCIGDVLMRIRAISKFPVRQPRGTISINCGVLRLDETVGAVMRKNPGVPFFVSSDAPRVAKLEFIPRFDRLAFSIDLSEESDEDDDGAWESVESAPMPAVSVEMLDTFVTDKDRTWIDREAFMASFICANVTGLEHSLEGVLDSLHVAPSKLLRGAPVQVRVTRSALTGSDSNSHVSFAGNPRRISSRSRTYLLPVYAGCPGRREPRVSHRHVGRKSSSVRMVCETWFPGVRIDTVCVDLHR